MLPYVQIIRNNLDMVICVVCVGVQIELAITMSMCERVFVCLQDSCSSVRSSSVDAGVLQRPAGAYR